MSNIKKRTDELPLEAQVKTLTKALEHVVVLSKTLERQRENSRLDSRYYSYQLKMLKLAWKGLVISGLEDYSEVLKEYMSDIEFGLNTQGESNE